MQEIQIQSILISQYCWNISSKHKTKFSNSKNFKIRKGQTEPLITTSVTYKGTYNCWTQKTKIEKDEKFLDGIWNWSSERDKGKKWEEMRTDWGLRRAKCRHTTPYSGCWYGQSRVLLPGLLHSWHHQHTKSLTTASRPPLCSWSNITHFDTHNDM